MLSDSAKTFSPEIIARARALFPHTQNGMIYLNHASLSPQSQRVVDAMMHHLNERCCGDINDTTYTSIIKSTKSLIHVLIHAESRHRIALTGNTSDAINIVVSGLPWQKGDRVLLNDLEFPANVYPFLNLHRFGVDIDFVKSENGTIPAEKIEAAITPATRLVSLSAVQFLSGYRADLANVGTLCRDKGILFFVDGIQAVGAVNIDVQAMRIDGLAAGCQKWQMGPKGTGFLYLTEALQQRIHQQYLGWLSVAEPWDFFNYDQSLSPAANRYEGGTANIPGLWGLEAALKTLLEFGIDGIERHIAALTQKLTRGILSMDGATLYSPVSPNDRAGIVTLKLPQAANPQRVFDGLTSGKIFISLREGLLRFSPHFYNTEEEIEESLHAIQALIK
ncbi:MAG: aminotransferase class V-fold PLP-dependent enzyme [Candidatus Zhuqueibacterota bacterium]